MPTDALYNEKLYTTQIEFDIPSVSSIFTKYNKDFNSYIINDNKFRTSGYPKEMVVEFSYDIDSGYSWQSNVIDALFPTFECEDRCSSFLFISLLFFFKCFNMYK
mgnify:CR=1 FL=1